MTTMQEPAHSMTPPLRLGEMITRTAAGLLAVLMLLVLARFLAQHDTL